MTLWVIAGWLSATGLTTFVVAAAGRAGHQEDLARGWVEAERV